MNRGLLLFTLGSLFLLSCGPIDKPEEPTDIKTRSLVVSKVPTQNPSNEVTFDESNGDQAIADFTYYSQFVQTLSVNSYFLQKQTVKNCNLKVTTSFGRAGAVPGEFDFEVFNIQDTLYLSPLTEYTLRWQLDGLSGCGEVKLSFSMLRH